jgi:acetyl-CoA carboxylase carboxyltransferase component
VKSKSGEMQFGGVIYGDAADKATRFIANCNQRKIPLVFLQDVTGFMVGTKAEHGGIIKDGAKMVNAVANSVVPKFTIVVGNSFGAGNYAMCGKAYDPRLILAWPTAKMAVMGGSQAANVLLQIEKSAAKKSGVKVDEKKEIALREKIDPAETRSWISMGIDMANHAPITEKFNMGILQV